MLTFTSIQSLPKDLGIEPREVLGFNTEEELELALLPLMKDCNEREHKNY